MTSANELNPTSRVSRPASRLCVLAAMTLLSCLLTSCTTDSSAAKVSPPVSLQIYQPRVLQLKAGQEVQTVAGLYRPQTDEVWHSAAAYNALEQENTNLAAALTQLRAKQN